jgi:predicted chitinase
VALEVATLTACGVPEDIARRQLPHMARAMRENGITTRPRARAFLATVLHESMGLRATTEQASGAKYEGRRDLGNTQPGDGQRFKGRGPIQLTGRANYSAYGRQLGLNLVAHPEQVAQPEVGWKVAGLFFKKCLPAADAGDFRRVTRLVNGGLNGWDDRLRYWNKLAGLGVVPGSPDIKRGAKGPWVQLLTRRLSYLVSKKTGKPYLDGKRSKFDMETTRALRRFQKERGLKVDGVFGPRVAAELDRLVRAEKGRRRKDRKPATIAAQPAATGAPAASVPAVTAASGTPATTTAPGVSTTPRRPVKKPRRADRVDRLWRRLERLDELSDKVRARLAAEGPPGRPGSTPGATAGSAAPEPAPPAAPPAEQLTTSQLIAELKRVDTESARMLVELEADLIPLARAPEVAPVGAPAEGTAATATVTSGEPATAPPMPAPSATAKSESHLRDLVALDQERDRLRGVIEQRVAGELAVEQAATTTVDNAEMQRFMALIGQLDALDVKADRVRAVLRKLTGVPMPAKNGAGVDTPDKLETKSGARTFRLGSKPMKGNDVRNWQKHLNRQLRKLKVDYEVGVDGEYGAETARCSKQVLYALGLTGGQWAGVTPQLRIKARNPDKRTAAEVAAARRRVPWLRKLRKRHAAPKGGIPAAVAYAKKHADLRTHETRTNGGPFIDDWCRGVDLMPGLATSAWCGAFANACLKQGGLRGWVWVRYTPSIVNNAKAGVDGWSWHQKPKIGDLVLFNWPGKGDFVDHVGVVVATRPDGSVRTVEGNMGNRVGYWDRKSMILGYARPPWTKG